ncbi:MAG: hypothetical protein HYW27_02480, partial [Candidatus Aenigmarchaeota archaeon]|nr:hypothetical protein [Candidatus Aenigmarchaeota archaeon]
MSKKSEIFLLSMIGIFVLASASLSAAARLPTVGSDNNDWGTVLNDYLTITNNSLNSVNNSLTILNNSFGQLSISLGALAFLGTITTEQITDGTITNDDLAGSIAAAKLVGT